MRRVKITTLHSLEGFVSISPEANCEFEAGEVVVRIIEDQRSLGENWKLARAAIASYPSPFVAGAMRPDPNTKFEEELRSTVALRVPSDRSILMEVSSHHDVDVSEESLISLGKCFIGLGLKQDYNFTRHDEIANKVAACLALVSEVDLSIETARLYEFVELCDSVKGKPTFLTLMEAKLQMWGVTPLESQAVEQARSLFERTENVPLRTALAIISSGLQTQDETLRNLAFWAGLEGLVINIAKQNGYRQKIREGEFLDEVLIDQKEKLMEKPRRELSVRACFHGFCEFDAQDLGILKGTFKSVYAARNSTVHEYDTTQFSNGSRDLRVLITGVIKAYVRSLDIAMTPPDGETP